MTIIPIVIGAFGIDTEIFIKGTGGLESRGRVETIQATASFRTVRIYWEES